MAGRVRWFHVFMQNFTAVPYTSMRPSGYLNNPNNPSRVDPECDFVSNPFGMYLAVDSLGTVCIGALVPWWKLGAKDPLILGNSGASEEHLYKIMELESDDPVYAQWMVHHTKREFLAEQAVLFMASQKGWSQDHYRLQAVHNKHMRLLFSESFAEQGAGNIPPEPESVGPAKRQREF
jgi:hypothetical protein